ncbi:unnamed protein product [Meloidogyne enterolobii]|uniref:Uncharacterized protein n=1 Tax=Meloidogyne enterolobii TaxID=390850 RepID=A0ACB0ZXV9_MELEN
MFLFRNKVLLEFTIIMNGTPKRLQFLPPQTRDNFVLRIIKSSFHAIFIWIFNVYNFTMLFVKKQYRKQQFVKYSVIPLSPLTAQRLCKFFIFIFL